MRIENILDELNEKNIDVDGYIRQLIEINQKIKTNTTYTNLNHFQAGWSNKERLNAQAHL